MIFKIVILCMGLLAGFHILPAMAGDKAGLDPALMKQAFGNVVFLSHVNTPAMPVFPGDPAPVFEPLSSVGEDGYSLHSVTMGEHSGTHWGAPSHFSTEGASADRLPPSSFVFPAVVIDIREKASQNPDYALSTTDVKAFEAAHGPVPDHAMVIAFTGWQARWNDSDAYFNTDDAGVMHFPGFSAEAVRWLVSHRKIGGLGIDTHGIDPGFDDSFAANTALLRDNRIHLENLAGLEHLPPQGAWIVVGGFRDIYGTGSPATVFGFLPGPGGLDKN